MTTGGAWGDAGTKSRRLRVNFIATWGLVQAAKLVLAACLPLFVDEAFYAWEGRHLAWAYSDLPGLTAWLTRLGSLLGGDSVFGIRLPFLLLGAALPWLCWRMARRAFGDAAGDWAGLLATLMPLSGMLGVMAVPDVPLVLGSLLCMDAMLVLRERIRVSALAGLAVGLVLGALSHYRFALVLVAGMAVFALDPLLRARLRDPRLWMVLAVGALAWWPLLQWNLDHAGAGLHFHLVERNPWRFHADGLAWLPIQCLLVTPPLFVLLLACLRECWRRRHQDGPWRLLGVAAAVAVPGLFVLGFFADDQRVSFHWPLAGWLLLILVAPVLLPGWSGRARIALLACAGAGLALALAFLAVAALPQARLALADTRVYPKDFAGWQEVQALAATLPQDRPWIAGDFELAAQLFRARPASEPWVLDSPLNHKHGRALQLQVWQRQWSPAATAGREALLVLDDSATPMKQRLRLYQSLCERLGPLPPAQELRVDRGRKRYLVFSLSARRPAGACIAPALSWIDAPASGERLASRFSVQGWAFKEGAGIRAVEIVLDGTPVARARYGVAMPHVAGYWRGSRDPNHPNVGFRADVDASAWPTGRHWLHLRLHGGDGSVENGPAQAIELRGD